MRYDYYGMIWRRLTLAFLALPFSGLVYAELQTGLQLEHDDRVRNFDLFIPAEADSNPRPLVLDLHGGGGNPSHQRSLSGLAEIAGQNNFLVAWPAGVLGTWNAVIGEDGIDDVGFLRALVDRISSQHEIDLARVYVTGFSQGGLMVNRLACEADDVFAAFASVAGFIVRGSEHSCSPLRPVSVLAWRGENDNLVPYQGDIIVLSAEEVFDFWRVKNDCSSTVDRLDLGSDLLCYQARNCGQETRTLAYTVQGSGDGGHVIYSNTAGLNLSRQNWSFFAPIAHPNPAAGSFTINAGLSDAWFYPLTNGQGFFVNVWEDLGQIFVGWFTYDVMRPPDEAESILGEPRHRWLTAQGPYTGDTAMLDVYVSSGGLFDSPEPPVNTPDNPPDPIGTMEITWEDCNTGEVRYSLASPESSGVIPIERITHDNIALCEALAGQ